MGYLNKFRSKLMGLCLVCMFALSAPLMAQKTSVSPGPGNSEQSRWAFTDSAGRTVQVPRSINRIAPSGPMAQIFLFTLVPDRIIGWSSKPASELLPYLSPAARALPVFGQFYGAASTLNMEALISAKPDIIIDIGERKPTIAQDMDDVQSRTGIPTVFIEASSFDSYGKTYRDLGKLLNVGVQSEQLAQFSETTVAYFKNLQDQLGKGRRKVRLYYGEDPSALMTIAVGSLHSQTIEFAGLLNVADLANKGGTGRNQVSMEQLLLWDPDLIILTSGAQASVVAQDGLFRQLRAVKQGRVYDIPAEPYNWVARPPSVNRLVGLYWLGHLAYPDLVSREMLEAKVKEFYSLFYHVQLGDAELKRFLP
ncbi:MAG: ABC transporter substrate-binding protein [Treponema sp.]|nr:ABC transporter substrate-binding protein [Treponema sp.]